MSNTAVHHRKIAEEAKSPEKRRSFASRFWGQSEDLGKYERIAALVFTIVAIASMSFTQLGFWGIGDIGGKPVYLMLLLAPLAMGALLFGPLAGALLGLFAGAVVFAHATFFPLDYYELYFMTPLNTFLLLTVFGAVAGFLFSFVLRLETRAGVRFGLIAVVCIVLSIMASVLVQLNTVLYYGAENYDTIKEYLLCSPSGLAVQILIDAAMLVLLCWLTDATVHKVIGYGNDRKLLAVFRSWMFLVSFVVFMLVSAVIFSAATIQAEGEAEQSMVGEVKYLEEQLSYQDHADLSTLLSGYDAKTDGTVVIVDKRGTILATDNNDQFGIGSSFLKRLGYMDDSYDSDLEGAVKDFFESSAEEGNAFEIQASDENGNLTMDSEFLAYGKYDGGYIAIVRTSDMIFANRFNTMFAATLLAVLLILAISFVASRLLNQVVVRRIDETNSSLEKITEGDLNERVSVRDSREFTSLSTGINATVQALKESITEAERKNAQELMTAKAIQENSLPTEFPAFPEIDRFDIYASMKTAKEVGGDFYDFFLIENTSKVGFIMADVSGKGIPAALFMMTAKTQMRNYMEANLPLGEAVGAANHQLCIGNDAGMFVTIWAAELDYETGVLTYVNGGHNPPMILQGGTWEWVRDVSGMPLGLFDGMPYDSFTRQLESGDVIYAYTDGVTEAMNMQGELFGEARLEETLSKYTELNPRSICVGVRRALTDFTLDCEQSDDITMLGLKYGVPPEEKAVMILPATTDQLVHVYNYIHAELHRRHAPKSVYNPLDIAAEELFVNVCHYAYPDATPENPGEVRISFEYEANPPSLTVQIADDGIPYDPLAKPDAVTPDDIRDVPIGGLGILMAKQSVDEMFYERVDGSNILTFKKGW